MNDMTGSRGWNNSASCPPNCPQQQMGAAAQDTAQMPFLSTNMQRRLINNTPTPQQQFASAETTSNYADLGMAATPYPAASQGMQNTAIQGLAPLEQLIGSSPSPTQLPGLTAIDLSSNPTAISLESLQYLNGFLVTQIGRKVTVTFLVGSNSMDVRSGELVGVGANYILLNEFESNDIVACDFYGIKFIKIYY